jgi:hypothetical protein
MWPGPRRGHIWATHPRLSPRATLPATTMRPPDAVPQRSSNSVHNRGASACRCFHRRTASADAASRRAICAQSGRNALPDWCRSPLDQFSLNFISDIGVLDQQAQHVGSSLRTCIPARRRLSRPFHQEKWDRGSDPCRPFESTAGRFVDTRLVDCTPRGVASWYAGRSLSCRPRAMSSGQEGYPEDSHGHFDTVASLVGSADQSHQGTPKWHGMPGRWVGLRWNPRSALNGQKARRSMTS